MCNVLYLSRLDNCFVTYETAYKSIPFIVDMEGALIYKMIPRLMIVSRFYYVYSNSDFSSDDYMPLAVSNRGSFNTDQINLDDLDKLTLDAYLKKYSIAEHIRGFNELRERANKHNC